MDNKNDAALALELLETIEKRKVLEKRESELKDLFKIKMGNWGVDTVNLRGVLIRPATQVRADSKLSLCALFGPRILSV